MGKNHVLLITSNCLGQGEAALGQKLIQGFLYTILEAPDTELPSNIIFINKGIELATINNDAVEISKEIENRGVTISTCGTCLNFYQLEDKLKVGEIGNMRDTQNLLSQADKVITIN